MSYQILFDVLRRTREQADEGSMPESINDLVLGNVAGELRD